MADTKHDTAADSWRTDGNFDIPLKPSTAIIFSTALGITIDDPIHFLATDMSCKTMTLCHQEQFEGSAKALAVLM